MPAEKLPLLHPGFRFHLRAPRFHLRAACFDGLKPSEARTASV